MVASDKASATASGQAVESIQEEFPSLPVAERYPFSSEAHIAVLGSDPSSSAWEGQGGAAAETDARFFRYLRFWLLLP